MHRKEREKEGQGNHRDGYNEMISQNGDVEISFDDGDQWWSK